MKATAHLGLLGLLGVAAVAGANPAISRTANPDVARVSFDHGHLALLGSVRSEQVTIQSAHTSPSMLRLFDSAGLRRTTTGCKKVDARTVLCPRPRFLSMSAGEGNDRVEVVGRLHSDRKPVIYAGSGDDLLVDDKGPSVLVGGTGDDRLRGGAGRDILSGQAGADRFHAGPGTDEALAAKSPTDRDRVIACGKGTDYFASDRVDPKPQSCEKKPTS
jgi:RTX calcium-binding nonapeptide repeat (4 copies)